MAKVDNAVFKVLCRIRGIPEPEAELRFHARRRWRFDFAWEAQRIALEIVGGVWTRGHHSRGQSQIDDMERRNEAQLLGWKVLEQTPRQVETGEVFALLKRAFGIEQ